MSDYPSPYFDQDTPEVPILGMIAEYDTSPSYELDARALFKTAHGYLLVEVSGCFCWPDRGGTTQTHFTRRADADKALAAWPELKDLVQAAGWKVAP